MHHFGNGLAIHHIRIGIKHPNAELLAKILNQLGNGGLVSQSVEGHIDAFFGEGAGHAQANTRGRAGDEGIF